MAEDDVSQEERAFHAVVGRAITCWADLEEVLFGIVLCVLGCTRERAAIVFYRTPTIDSRLTLTNDLVHSFFPRHEDGEQPDPRIKRWREIQADIREALPVRNRLAHHPIGPVLIYEEGKGEPRIAQASYMSEPEHLRKREFPRPLDAAEIRAHIQGVSHIINDIRNLYRQEFPGPPQEPGELFAPHIPRPDRDHQS